MANKLINDMTKTNFLNLIINPKNKVYKTFVKRGFLENGILNTESYDIPRIGEKIHLMCYGSLNKELKTFLQNRHKPIVFIIEDVIYSTWGLDHKIDGKNQQTNCSHIYLKVSEIDNYNPYRY